MEQFKQALSEEEAKRILEDSYEKSSAIVADEDKLERLLQRLEKKMKIVPVVGEYLADVPIMASLLRSYLKKEYTDIPIGSLVAIVSALAYFVSPVDLIPDMIPGVGYIDDGAVVVACLKMVDTDIKEYKDWRLKNGKTLDIPEFESDIKLNMFRKNKKNKS